MVGGSATPTAWETLPQVPRHWLPLCAYGKSFAVLVKDCNLQGIEVLLDLSPGKGMAGFFQFAVKRLSQDQGKEAAKHMATDRLVPLVENRSRLKGRFEVPESVLDLPECQYELWITGSNLHFSLF